MVDGRAVGVSAAGGTPDGVGAASALNVEGGNDGARGLLRSHDGTGGPRALSAPDLADVVARFAALLHAAGVPVGPDRAGRLATGIAISAPYSIDELYWLARVTLVGGLAEIAVFDRVFAQVFGGFVDPADFRGQTPPPVSTRAGAPGPQQHPDGGPPSPDQAARRDGRPRSRLSERSRKDGSDPEEPDQSESLVLLAAASAEERLRTKDFSALSPAELEALRSLATRVAVAPPPRRSRRASRHRSGDRLDVRATLRRSRRSGGEPLVAVRRRLRSHPRRLVAICDVSGSMEQFARAYLTLLLATVRSPGSRAEAFVFATRLTRLTKALRVSSPDLALERAGRAAPDWSGGTRIGEALKAFNDGFGRRGMARGAVVVVVSDGWERSDTALVSQEMARLSRLAFRVVWVNPRKAAPGYAPLTGGMAAALPYVDRFVSGHNLAAFDEVLEAVRSA